MIKITHYKVLCKAIMNQRPSVGFIHVEAVTVKLPCWLLSGDLKRSWKPIIYYIPIILSFFAMGVGVLHELFSVKVRTVLVILHEWFLYLCHFLSCLKLGGWGSVGTKWFYVLLCSTQDLTFWSNCEDRYGWQCCPLPIKCDQTIPTHSW